MSDVCHGGGNQKLIKILRLAVDSRTSEPEAMAAFSAVRKLRHGWDGLVYAVVEYAATNLEGPKNGRVHRAPKPEPEVETVSEDEIKSQTWRFREMPFGKHKGKNLDRILDEDRDYLEWLIDNVKLKGTLKDDIQSALDSVF